MPQRRSASLRLVLLAGAAASMLAFAGCDRADPVEQQLRLASATLDAMSGGGAGIPGKFMTDVDSSDAKSVVDKQTAAFKSVLDSVSKLTSTGQPAQAGAAQVLQARASGGLGTLALNLAAEEEQKALDAYFKARAVLDVYRVQSTRATSLARYSPDGDLKDLDAQIAVTDAAIAASNKAKTDAESAITALEKQVSDLLKQAKGERVKSATLSNDAAKMTAVQGLPLVEQAMQISRAADALERRASDFASDADVIRPRVIAATTQAADTAGLREQLQQSKARVNERATKTAASAADARKQSDDSITALDAHLAAVDTARKASESIEVNGKPALEHFQAAAKSAAGAAKSMGTDAASASGAAIGTYNQRVGDILASRAVGLTLQAQILGDAAAITPALPKQAEYAAAAKAATEAAEAARTESKAAYQSALAGFEKAGSRGETKDFYEQKVLPFFRAAAEDKNAEPVAPKAEDTTEAKPQEKTETKPVAAADDPAVAAVRVALGKIIAAAKNADGAEVAALVVPAQRQAMKTAMSFMGKVTPLNEACKEKFGKSFAEVLASGPMGAMMGSAAKDMDAGPLGMGDAKAEDLNVKMLGADRAQVSNGDTDIFEMVKTDGAWLASIKALEEGSAAMPPDMAEKLGPVFDTITADVKSGKIGTPEALTAAFQQGLMKAMMPKPPKGG